MFGEVRPFDWLMLAIEALVLVLIAYEVGVGILERARHRRQKLALNSVIGFLSELMNKGEQIRRDIPSPYETPALGVREREDWTYKKRCEWQKTALQWIKDTNEALAQHSPRASSAFMLIADPLEAQPLLIADKRAGPSFTIVGNDREVYQRLVGLLDNLRGIIEKPEAYF